MITKSQLNTYEYCPYRFFREYILKIKYPPNASMSSGTKLHDYFEWFFKHWAEVEPDKWDLLIPDEFTPKEKEMCSVFHKGEKARLDGLKSLGLESEFTPPYTEFHVKVDPLDLHGYLDRVDYWKKESNEFVIVEYKTGFGHNIQKLKHELAFYKYIFEEAKLGTVPYYLVINPNRRVREYVKASSRGVSAVKKRIEILRKAIADNNFPKQCSPEKKKYCRHCDDGDCYNHQL